MNVVILALSTRHSYAYCQSLQILSGSPFVKYSSFVKYHSYLYKIQIDSLD